MGHVTITYRGNGTTLHQSAQWSSGALQQNFHGRHWEQTSELSLIQRKHADSRAKLDLMNVLAGRLSNPLLRRCEIAIDWV
jgi:hypothetical protein